MQVQPHRQLLALLLQGYQRQQHLWQEQQPWKVQQQQQWQ